MQTPPKLNSETPRLRLGLLLGALGFFGAASVLLIDIEKLISLLPPSANPCNVKVTPALMLLSLVQPAVLIALAVTVGLFATKGTGLRAPVFEAAARREPWLGILGRAVPIGIVGGIVGGVAIVAVMKLLGPHLPADVAARIGSFMAIMPLPTRLLYGGITEEVLLRWGFMSALVWVGWRVAANKQPTPPAMIFVAAILGSAFVFGLGHLPVAFMLVPKPTLTLIAFVIVANSAFGLVAGWLFWKRGLESAIIAHVTTHLVLWSASRLGIYF